MKRCIVCGNIGDDDSVVCSVCGNPFIDMEGEADGGEDSLKPDEKIEEQLKEVLTKVQDDEPMVQPDTVVESKLTSALEMLQMDEPGVTVLPEEDFARSARQSGEADESLSQAAPVTDAGAEDMYEAFAKRAETHAKQAEVYAKQAETYAEHAEACAKQAETFVERVAEEPVQNAAEAFAKRMVEAPAKNEAVMPVESGAEVLLQREREASADPETVAVEETEASVKAEVNAPRQAAARPRRTKGGPQIYGQESMAEFDGAQGVIRRDVHGGHSGESVAYRSEIPGDPVQPRRRPDTAGRQTAAASAGQRAAQRPSDGRMAAGQSAAGNVNNASRAAGGQQKPPVQPYAQIPQENRGVLGQAGHAGGKSSGMARRVIEASKDALTSPLLILVALFQTVFLAGSVAAIFMRELSYGQIAKLLNLLDLPSQLSGYVSMFQSAMAQLDNGALAINLAIRVPDLLLCLGLWLICILSHSSKKMPGIGFVLMQIVTIIEMIAACAVLLVVLILSVTLVIAAWSGGTQSLLIIAVATLVGAIVVTMAIVMYFFCYLSTIRIVSVNARTGECCGKVSAYVAVIHMILAVTGIINILSGIVNLEMTGIAAGVGQLGWMLLFGVWILKYRSTLSEYNE
ncbi:MAG: hypothetical protein LUH00_05590 [Lachnospiraceae bacterium]|nr:hypothetical protein [Lachnospiraceae bacterium]